jgi:hypothetical protein
MTPRQGLAEHVATGTKRRRQANAHARGNRFVVHSRGKGAMRAGDGATASFGKDRHGNGLRWSGIRAAAFMVA